ncbi:ROK family transcriptional regulator [Rhodobacter sp. KR11]|uniref:ROK family transcriptional regulator n=1 Tax=Rhodobacter sp. KR11 TaxID=2974588 RepID=UPI0022239094|nr:ROK family transcriptional regulator [Rhodobacter sp. KR11]MCW1919059.1 ROK family transcriptional regulator [Rhodobacter sp. KR11]
MHNAPRLPDLPSEKAALRAIYEAGRLSRADLARVLGLNRSSAGHIIAGLLDRGLVRETSEPAPTPGPGRPGILLDLIPEAMRFLGLEIGVEHISVVELDFSARVLRAETLDFDGASPETGLARALDLAGRPPRLAGIGIAVPAQMDRTGGLRLAPLLGWRDLDLAALARQVGRLPDALPLQVENDANAFALGVTWGRRMAAPGVTLLVNMETGVGGGILIDGRLFRGGGGLAGEIGHMQLGPNGPGVESRLGLGRLMADYGGGLPAFLTAVADREPRAVLIAEDWAQTLAFALTQTCRIIDADRVILGGSVAALYPLVAARVQAHRVAAQSHSFALPPIDLAPDSPYGAAFGAAAMMHQRALTGEATPS